MYRKAPEAYGWWFQYSRGWGKKKPQFLSDALGIERVQLTVE
jgi:hypothetical protein